MNRLTLNRINFFHEITTTPPKFINVDKISRHNATDVTSDSPSIHENGFSSIDISSEVSEILCQRYDISIDVMRIVCPTLFAVKTERASRSNDSDYTFKNSGKIEANDPSSENSSDVPIKLEDTNDYELGGNTKCMCNATSTDSEHLVCFSTVHSFSTIFTPNSSFRYSAASALIGITLSAMVTGENQQQWYRQHTSALSVRKKVVISFLSLIISIFRNCVSIAAAFIFYGIRDGSSLSPE